MSSVRDHSPGIAVFLAVFESGSTLAAAKALGMSQATVARRIKELERRLGIRLFEQDTRGSRPTANAEKLRDAACDIKDSIARFADIAEQLQRQESRHICIGGPSPLFEGDTADAFAEFTRKHPGTKFEVISSDRPISFADGKIDVAIMFTHRIDDPSVVRRKVGILQNGFYAAHEYAAVNGLPASETDLGDHKFIGLAGENMPVAVLQWMKTNVPPDQIATEAAVFQTLLNEIRMGTGIGPLPALFGDTLIGLVRAFPPPKALDLPAWLAVSPKAAHRPIVRSFTDFFAPRLKRILKEKASGSGH